MPLSSSWFANDQTCLFEQNEMFVNARSAHIQVLNQATYRARPAGAEYSQDLYLSPVAQKCNSRLNVLRQGGLDKSRHLSILPEVGQHHLTPF